MLADEALGFAPEKFIAIVAEAESKTKTPRIDSLGSQLVFIVSALSFIAIKVVVLFQVINLCRTSPFFD